MGGGSSGGGSDAEEKGFVGRGCKLLADCRAHCRKNKGESVEEEGMKRSVRIG